jgi:MtN3 and saliva related transmembrane protein
METATVVGYLASVLSIASFTPQAWKIIKSRDVSAISAKMYVATVSGFALWTVFGLLKGEWPIIVTNSVCFALSAFILFMKVVPRKKREQVADNLDPHSRETT